MRNVAAPKNRHDLGQFLSPVPVANFMASLFEQETRAARLLDAGAGSGALSAALVERWCKSEHKPESITVSAYELDAAMIPSLERRYAECETLCLLAGIEFKAEVLNTDFIAAVVPLIRGDLLTPRCMPFSAAILNPPYRKIQSDSSARRLLRSVGIETSNLYAAFLALAAELLNDNGELVAITPRSFCNGPYFKPFRQRFLRTMSLRRLHLFDSRSAAFRGDNVLQENLIVHAVKSPKKSSRVIVSMSKAVPPEEMVERVRDYAEIVSPSDREQFIHLVFDGAQEKARQSVQNLFTQLETLGLEVSTGKVVDFRARDFLVSEPEDAAWPLIHPCHFRNGFVQWPLTKSRKANAILDVGPAQDLLVKSGIYVLVKRFSSKEERRRIVACIYDPRRIPANKVGFENHLNYFHARNRTFPMLLAKGISAYLNSTMVDVYFRQFNGHTQVNATDLRNLPYPALDQLQELGVKIGDAFPEQDALDELVADIIF